jgi:putative transposase
MVAYIGDHRDEFGAEPICRELQVAPSTYYAARSRPASARAVRDAVLMALWKANYEVYGIRKLWKAATRAGETIGRDQVARLMRELGIAGARRAGRSAPLSPMAGRRGHRIWWTASSSRPDRTRCG